MAGMGKGGGQRKNLSTSGGAKKRTPTSTSRKGSRVDPSHVTESKRGERAKKAARAAKAVKKKGG